MHIIRTAALAAAILVVAPAAWAKDCDRQCLIDTADKYIAALAAHDPGKAPLAKTVVTVENIHRIQVGEGLWKTATGGATDFKILVPDPVSQEVGGIVMMSEDNKPIELGFRLKLDNGKIVEAEHVIARNLREAVMPNLQKPRGQFLQEVPEGYADSRERLIAIAKSYYDAVDDNNGDLGNFADDCERRENGIQTARNKIPDDTTGFSYLGALGCAAQLDTQVMAYIDTIGNRRVEIADPVTGLVFGLSHFHHSMQQHDFPIIGVPGVTSRHLDNGPFDLPAAHIFKIWGGKTHGIEALGFVTDYNSPSGWEK